MEKCNNNCQICNIPCLSNCPLCKGKGIEIPLVTAKSLLIKPKYLNENKIYVCPNRKCEVNYFQEGNPNYFINSDLKRQIWFKTSLKSQIICYCHDIKLTDVINIVFDSKVDKLTKDDIFKILKLNIDNSNCIYNNPLGENCDKLFKSAIEYAYKLKEENKLEK